MQKKKKLIAPILFLCYEESVCPLILKYNKFYFETSLITKPIEYVYQLSTKQKKINVALKFNFISYSLKIQS